MAFSFYLCHSSDLALPHRTGFVRCGNAYQDQGNSFLPIVSSVNKLCFFLKRLEGVSPLCDRSCKLFMSLGIFLK